MMKFNLKDLQSAYTGLLCEAKIDDLLEKSDLSPDQQEKVRSINDKLSNKTKYINFLIKNVEGVDVENYILYVDKYSQAFPGLNMDKASIGDIYDLVQDHQHKKEMEKIHPEAEKIFEDEDVLIVSPLTYKASVYYGKGTNWCISTSNPTFWHTYTGNYEKMYFILSKKYPITNRFSKVAVQIIRNEKPDGEIGEFRDKFDKEINKYSINIYDFLKYRPYLKPMEITVETMIRKHELKYNEETKMYDCEKWVEIKENSPLIKDGKLVIKFGHVKGFFDISFCNNLTTLEGCPEKVDGGFSCNWCKSLTSLKGAPKEVGLQFYCMNCKNLTSLEGAPEKISNSFKVNGCDLLKSLKGSPQQVGLNFTCTKCVSLTSLEGGPQKVEGYYDCSGCSSLTSLKGVPKIINDSFVFNRCKSLESLEGMPSEVGVDVFCDEKFAEEVKKICKVGRKIVTDENF